MNFIKAQCRWLSWYDNDLYTFKEFKKVSELIEALEKWGVFIKDKRIIFDGKRHQISQAELFTKGNHQVFVGHIRYYFEK